MEVSSRDLILWVSVSSLKGLGLVSVSRLKGLGLARDYSIETLRLEERKMKIEAWKKHSVSGRFLYPQWKKCRKTIPSEKMIFFLCRKIFDKKNIGSRSRKASCTWGLLQWWSLGLIIRDQDRIIRDRDHLPRSIQGSGDLPYLSPDFLFSEFCLFFWCLRRPHMVYFHL